MFDYGRLTYRSHHSFDEWSFPGGHAPRVGGQHGLLFINASVHIGTSLLSDRMAYETVRFDSKEPHNVYQANLHRSNADEGMKDIIEDPRLWMSKDPLEVQAFGLEDRVASVYRRSKGRYLQQTPRHPRPLTSHTRKHEPHRPTRLASHLDLVQWSIWWRWTNDAATEVVAFDRF